MQAVYCPICDGPCSDEPIYRYTVSEAAAHFCPCTRDADRNRRLTDCIRRLWHGESSVILRCSHCGFAFGYPFVGGDEEFYGILHEQKGYPAWRWDYDYAIDRVLSEFDSGRILEIGAGVGNFLKSLGSQWECFAIETSESNKRDLTSAGIQLFLDLPAAVAAVGRTFNVIALFQVLEHIAEFKTVLAHCRDLLVPGGQLVITVPDGDAMIRQERLTGCPDMPPNHINKFTPASLSRALDAAGFSPGPSFHERPSWNSLKTSLQLRVMADAMDQGSVAAQIYRVSNRRLRQLFVAILGGPALIRMLPHVRDLRAGGAFAIVASRR